MANCSLLLEEWQTQAVEAESQLLEVDGSNAYGVFVVLRGEIYKFKVDGVAVFESQDYWWWKLNLKFKDA